MKLPPRYRSIRTVVVCHVLIVLLSCSSSNARDLQPVGNSSSNGFPLVKSFELAAGNIEVKPASPHNEARQSPISGGTQMDARLATDNRDCTPAGVPTAPTRAFEEKSFRVTSILIGSGAQPKIAVVNGRAYGEGEFLRPSKDSGFRVRVKQINENNVVLEHDNQTVVVPLRPPEPKKNKGDYNEPKTGDRDSKTGESK